MLPTRSLILSSSSAARRTLLTRLQLPFSTTSPDVDETPLPGEEAYTMVQRLAELKARKSASLYPDELIEYYLEREKPFQCAGSFQAERLGIMLINKFQGNDYTARERRSICQLI